MVESAIEGLAICTTRKQRQGQWLSGRIVAYTDCTDYTLLRSHYGGNDPVGRTDKLYIVNLVTQNTIHTSTNLLIGNTIVLKKKLVTLRIPHVYGYELLNIFLTQHKSKTQKATQILHAVLT